LRAHGAKPKYYHAVIGGNFRLDAVQAAVVLAKLKHLDKWTEARQANAAHYRELFEEAALLDVLALPHEAPAGRHIYNQFIIRTTQRRDALRAFIEEHGIATEIYYPRPMHFQECYKSLGYQKGDLPESEAASEQTLGIPVHPELTGEQQQYVFSAIQEFFGR